MKRATLAFVLALVGCGGAPTEVTRPVAPGDGVPASITALAVRPGEPLLPPSGPCQDVLVVVREGRINVSGTGIAPDDAPTVLDVGDAALFGPEGDGRIVTETSASAFVVAAVVRSPGSESPLELDRLVRLPRAERVPATCTNASEPPRVRVARFADTPELLASEGRLAVHILFDAETTGSRYAALSLLEGQPSLGVPAHAHASSAEVLYIEHGDGTMHVDARALELRPALAVYVPSGVRHDLVPRGTQPLRAVQLYLPPGPEQRFRAGSPLLQH